VVRDEAYYENIEAEAQTEHTETDNPYGFPQEDPWNTNDANPFPNPISTPPEQQQTPTQEQGQAPPEQAPPTESPPNQTQQEQGVP
jgi:hypothetical protein